MKKNQPPKKPPQDPRIGKTVWMACRASNGCEGRNCEVKRTFKLPTGGQSIHYKCLSCNKGFTITF